MKVQVVNIRWIICIKGKHNLINDISHRIEFLRLDVPRSISVLSESEAVILQEC